MSKNGAFRFYDEEVTEIQCHRVYGISLNQLFGLFDDYSKYLQATKNSAGRVSWGSVYPSEGSRFGEGSWVEYKTRCSGEVYDMCEEINLIQKPVELQKTQKFMLRTSNLDEYSNHILHCLKSSYEATELSHGRTCLKISRSFSTPFRFKYTSCGNKYKEILQSNLDHELALLDQFLWKRYLSRLPKPNQKTLFIGASIECLHMAALLQKSGQRPYNMTFVASDQSSRYQYQTTDGSMVDEIGLGVFAPTDAVLLELIKEQLPSSKIIPADNFAIESDDWEGAYDLSEWFRQNFSCKEIRKAFKMYEKLHTSLVGKFEFSFPESKIWDSENRSIYQLLKDNNLQCFENIFKLYITLQGLGSLSDFPSLPALQIVTPMLLAVSLQNIMTHQKKKKPTLVSCNVGLGKLKDALLYKHLFENQVEKGFTVKSISLSDDSEVSKKYDVILTDELNEMHRSFDFIVMGSNVKCFTDVQTIQSVFGVLEKQKDHGLRACKIDCAKEGEYPDVDFRMFADALDKGNDVYLLKNIYENQKILVSKTCMNGAEDSTDMNEFYHTNHDLGEQTNIKTISMCDWLQVSVLPFVDTVRVAEITRNQGKDNILFIQNAFSGASLNQRLNYNMMLFNSLKDVDEPLETTQFEYKYSMIYKYGGILLSSLSWVLFSIWYCLSLIVAELTYLRVHRYSVVSRTYPTSWCSIFTLSMKRFVDGNIVAHNHTNFDSKLAKEKEETNLLELGSEKFRRWSLDWVESLPDSIYIGKGYFIVLESSRYISDHIFNFILPWILASQFRFFTGYSFPFYDNKGPGLRIPSCSFLKEAVKKHGQLAGQRICNNGCKILVEEQLRLNGLDVHMYPDYLSKHGYGCTVRRAIVTRKVNANEHKFYFPRKGDETSFAEEHLDLSW